MGSARKGHCSMGLEGWQGSSTYPLGVDPGLCRLREHRFPGWGVGAEWIAPVQSSALIGCSCRW